MPRTDTPALSIIVSRQGAEKPPGPPPLRHLPAAAHQVAPVLRAPAVTVPVIDEPGAIRHLPPASSSRLRRRHFGLMISFVVLVVLPALVAAWYLWTRAADQYASTLGFSVHREGTTPGLSLLSGLSSLSGSSSADTDIIYTYLSGQQLVAEIDKKLDLRAIWSKAEGDPYFTFDTTGSIEDLVEYWERMVSVSYDSTTHLIEIRVLAFTPEDAQRIAQAIFDESTVMINQLNDIAAQDTVRFAREEMDKTRADLIEIRNKMTEFRNKNQFVDPAADLVAQSTILGSLQQELAASLIELDVLKETSTPNDPRIPPAERRIKVIEDRIQVERGKMGDGSQGDSKEAYVAIVATFEALTADRVFAETAYQAARTAYEVARAEASRQSRYLAAHTAPTLAETSRFPERGTLFAIVSAFLVMLWSIGTLIYYSLRDRR